MERLSPGCWEFPSNETFASLYAIRKAEESSGLSNELPFSLSAYSLFRLRFSLFKLLFDLKITGFFQFSQMCQGISTGKDHTRYVSEIRAGPSQLFFRQSGRKLPLIFGRCESSDLFKNLVEGGFGIKSCVQGQV